MADQATTLRNATRGEGVDAAVDRQRPTIGAALDALEREHDFRIVYACESGSRAWGFASQDSDFDIRFIFVRSPERYLRLNPPKDAFDVHGDGDLDLGGWDIRKCAELMRKSNPPLLEWLDSPIVYRADDQVTPELVRLRSVYFDPKKTVHHYLRMAVRVYESYLDEDEPKRKKYLYVLRPLACVRHIALHAGQPPTEFDRVLHRIDWPARVIDAVSRLVTEKRNGDELGRARRDTVLDELIQSELQAATQLAESLAPNEIDNAQLDRMVQAAVFGSDSA